MKNLALCLLMVLALTACSKAPDDGHTYIGPITPDAVEPADVQARPIEKSNIAHLSGTIVKQTADWQYNWYANEVTKWPVDGHTLKWNSARTVFAWVPDVDNGTTVKDWITFIFNDELQNNMTQEELWNTYGVIDWRPDDLDWKRKFFEHDHVTNAGFDNAAFAWVWNDDGSEGLWVLNGNITDPSRYTKCIDNPYWGYDLKFD